MGWKLLPVARDKKPLIMDWVNAASDDAEQIMEWFERWPDANLGLATGRRSGVYVVDVDKKNDGPSRWQELLDRHGETSTATSMTGGGGFHLFFEAPPFELPNSTGRLASGIDTRGDGGYVVLPPSVHESGKTYEWSSWVKTRPLPNWISDAVRQPMPKSRPLTTGGIVEGVRNDTLARYAGALRNVGAGRDSIEAALSAINDATVDPPLPEREVRLIAKSISRYAPGEARGDALVVLDDERKWVEYTGLELANLPEPEVTWVVPWIAAKGTVTMLAGEWKTAGKTTLLISAVRSALRGEHFLGKPTRRSPVVYLYEGPVDEFNQNDFARQLHHEDFHLVPQDENTGRSWQETIEYATARCIELGAELLVIDTKTAWLDQEKDEENQSGFARQAMNMLAEAKLAGIAVVVAAHPTKAGGDLSKMVAGSGQWAASAGRQVGLWLYERWTTPAESSRPTADKAGETTCRERSSSGTEKPTPTRCSEQWTTSAPTTRRNTGRQTSSSWSPSSQTSQGSRTSNSSQKRR